MAFVPRNENLSVILEQCPPQIGSYNCHNCHISDPDESTVFLTSLCDGSSKAWAPVCHSKWHPSSFATEDITEGYSEGPRLSHGQGLAPSKVVTDASWWQELELLMGTFPGCPTALTHHVQRYGGPVGMWLPDPFVELLSLLLLTGFPLTLIRTNITSGSQFPVSTVGLTFVSMVNNSWSSYDILLPPGTLLGRSPVVTLTASRDCLVPWFDLVAQHSLVETTWSGFLLVHLENVLTLFVCDFPSWSGSCGWGEDIGGDEESTDGGNMEGGLFLQPEFFPRALTWERPGGLQCDIGNWLFRSTWHI